MSQVEIVSLVVFYCFLSNFLFTKKIVSHQFLPFKLQFAEPALSCTALYKFNFIEKPLVYMTIFVHIVAQYVFIHYTVVSKQVIVDKTIIF